MNDKVSNTKKIAQSAIFCALIFAFTMIQVPAPTVGNVNLGDSMLILAAYFLGGAYAVIAAGLGSALSDLLSGYVIYAPGTFVIKCAMAVVIIVFCEFVFKKDNNLSLILSALVAEVLMIVGYFIYESAILSYGLGAIANVPFNAVQGGINIVVAIVLYNILKKIFNSKSK